MLDDTGSTSATPGMTLDGQEVRIRMYGQGVGDCFLIAFPRRPDAGAQVDRPVFALVDCGVIGGTPGGPQRMKRVVRNIAEATGGRLDVLVLTHEHWDHISGFIQAKEEWDPSRIKVDWLWLAWTESGEAGLPTALKTILDRQRQAVTRAADAALRFGLADRHETLLGLTSFLCDPGEGLGFAAAAGTADAFAAAKALVPHDHHVYGEPGNVLRVPGSTAIAYVLGPPRDDARLRQLNPSVKKPETFEGPGKDGTGDGGVPLAVVADGRSAFNSLAMPLLGLGPTARSAGAATSRDEEDLVWRTFPFDRTLRVAMPEVESEVEAAPGTYAAFDSYFDETNHWRRIDYDWLGATEEFAIQADSLTNNTSLVLAFEVPPGTQGEKPRVLLFAGDAQVGNWLSWDDLTTWRPLGDAMPSQTAPDIPELLGRTAFYKVGHHGSHNATLKEKGVERMRAPSAGGHLAAFVPVSPGVAHKIKHWGQMPLEELLDGLTERAPERVVLPNGMAWAPKDRDATVKPDGTLDLRRSNEQLPAIGDGIDGPVPLWVEMRIAL